MNRFVAVVALIASFAASAAYLTWAEDQNLTRAVPTGSQEGVALTNVSAFRVSVCAADGQTLAGAGALHAYVWNYTSGAWMRNPDLDHAISVTATSCSGAACPCQAWPDQAVGLKNTSRVLYAANGVTVSGGTQVRVRIDYQRP